MRYSLLYNLFESIRSALQPNIRTPSYVSQFINRPFTFLSSHKFKNKMFVCEILEIPDDRNQVKSKVHTLHIKNAEEIFYLSRNYQYSRNSPLWQNSFCEIGYCFYLKRTYVGSKKAFELSTILYWGEVLPICLFFVSITFNLII